MNCPSCFAIHDRGEKHCWQCDHNLATETAGDGKECCVQRVGSWHEEALRSEGAIYLRATGRTTELSWLRGIVCYAVER